MSSRNARVAGRAMVLATVLAIATPALAHAQRASAPPSRPVIESSPPARIRAPAVSRDSARALVLAAHRGATMVSQRLMLRDGRPVYSVRIRAKGRPNTTRVLVDATTGELSR